MGPSSAVRVSPRIDVVVAARDEARTIVRCVRSLLGQSCPPHEVIVVDDGSTDGTGAMAEAAGARVIRGPGHGPGCARNLGIASSHGDVVAFIDADAYADVDWLAQLAAVFAADPGLCGAGGVQLAPDDATAFQRRLQAFLECVGFVSDYVRPRDGAVRPTTHNPSCNSAYRRAELLSASGFREDLFPCEDLDLDRRLMRAGRRLAFVPGARVHHYRVASRAGFARMMTRYGAAHRRLVALHGRFRLLHWVPVAAPAAVLLLLPLLPVPPLALGGIGLGALAAALGLAVRGGLWALPSNLDLLALTLRCWLAGYYRGVDGGG